MRIVNPVRMNRDTSKRAEFLSLCVYVCKSACDVKEIERDEEIVRVGVRQQASTGPRLAFSHEGMCWPCHVSR